MSTRIRQATPADTEALLRIDAASFPPHMAYDAAELRFFMSRPGAETLALESDGTVAAFILFEAREKAKAATIVTIDVLERFRRSGYASLLIQAMEAALAPRQVERIRLQVSVDNAAAIALYRKHGFRRDRRLPDYYEDGTDAYQMIKTLRSPAGKSRSALPVKPGFLP